MLPRSKHVAYACELPVISTSVSTLHVVCARHAGAELSVTHSLFTIDQVGDQFHLLFRDRLFLQ